MGKKKEKLDGLSSDDLKKLSTAIRRVWAWSTPRRIAVKRCQNEEGFSICEQCKKLVAKIFIDHIIPCGAVDSEGFIERLYVPSTGLQALCKTCHAKKTRQERGLSGTR